MKSYIVQRHDDSSYHIIRSSQYPKSKEYKVVGTEVESDDASILDFVDVLNEQGDVVGKRGVISPEKIQVKIDKENQAKLQKQQKEEKNKQLTQEIKQSYSNFDSLTSEQKDDLLKKLLEKTLNI